MLILLALLATPDSSDAARWSRLTTPHFEILFDVPETTARTTARKLNEVRQIFGDVRGVKGESPLPIRVYLFGSSSEFQRFRPSANTKGFYQGGADSDFIVIDGTSADPWRVAFHEYVHVVLEHSSARLPQWLEEGTAELYATLEISGGKLFIGKRIENHVKVLRETRPWLEAEELTSTDHGSAIYQEEHRIGLFYAQSWALVHMLNLAEPYREKMPAYASLLAEARDPVNAFEGAFGVSMDDALRELRRYVNRQSWPLVTREWMPEDVPGELVVTPLTDEEVDRAQLDLELRLGRWSMSEQKLERLARKKRDTPDVETARGLIALSRDLRDQARQHFARAIELGTTDASTYFEYAVLLREAGEAPREVGRLLERAVELNSNFAEAYFLMGVMAANEGRHEDAIEPLERAVAVLPRQANFWHALALAYHRTGRNDDAHDAARRALNSARNAEEAKMARAAISLTTAEDPVVELRERPAVSTPESWVNRQGDARVEGTLVAIDCLGAQARLRIRHQGGETALLVADPSKIVLRNHSSAKFEFACGDGQRLPVAAEYVERTDTETGTEGEVTAIELQ